ncbi:MAG: hypothetical protein K2Q32_02705 [Alphaproteobacteria bacterium]|nr:hypothetical protein [Alphaproteobacteria bacterium]
MNHLLANCNAYYESPPEDQTPPAFVLSALDNMQKTLRLSGDEQLRMEDEGGPSLDDNQANQVDACFKASTRIQDILLYAQHLFPLVPSPHSLIETC